MAPQPRLFALTSDRTTVVAIPLRGTCSFRIACLRRLFRFAEDARSAHSRVRSHSGHAPAEFPAALAAWNIPPPPDMRPCRHLLVIFGHLCIRRGLNGRLPWTGSADRPGGPVRLAG